MRVPLPNRRVHNDQTFFHNPGGAGRADGRDDSHAGDGCHNAQAAVFPCGDYGQGQADDSHPRLRIEAPFRETVRKDLAAYIRDNKMNKPVIVGHSLGGVLALWLAEREPDLVGPLVIVDSLPFLAAIMNPDATAESVKAQAEQMRKMYSGPPTEQTEKMGEMAVKAMVTSPADFEMIMGWSRKSDRVAMGDAIYEMMTTDLRGDLDKIASPTLVLGTWIAYKQYTTREEVEKNFRTQYAKLKNYDFVLSDKARHFVMLDDIVV